MNTTHIMETMHEVRSEAKVEQLVLSIEEHGWVGAPLVTWGPYQLLTGTHRYAACKELEIADRDIPMIDITDIFTAAELDFQALWHEYEDIAYILNHYLPEAMREKYGIDIH